MPVIVNSEQRERLLKYAAAIALDPSDAAAVAEAAFCLLDWAEQATDKGDLGSRVTALSQHWNNAGSRARTGDPVAFVGQAQVLYAFSTAADQSEALS